MIFSADRMTQAVSTKSKLYRGQKPKSLSLSLSQSLALSLAVLLVYHSLTLTHFIFSDYFTHSLSLFLFHSLSHSLNPSLSHLFISVFLCNYLTISLPLHTLSLSLLCSLSLFIHSLTLVLSLSLFIHSFSHSLALLVPHSVTQSLTHSLCYSLKSEYKLRGIAQYS
jgi:hypothetical protein